ncbi:PIN-like domain-containing protein [Paenibacillus sp. FSL R7-0128]|uniref:PIN-like domain-containing protein n=1 Tax=Paenibacillus sp. FSL R7-0128 TaxID=2954529 RepID=UPI0030FC687F
MDDFNQFKCFWDQKGLVIFDTNVLLNLYNYSIDSTKEIIKNLEKINDRIWLPGQVYLEFQNNKKKVSQKSFGKYETVKKDVSKLLDNTITSLYDTLGKCNKFRYPTFTDIINLAIENIKCSRDDLTKVDDDIETEKKLNRELLDDDIINKFLENLHSKGQIGVNFSHIELISIYVEGDTRYKLGIPPGFKDKKKLNSGDSEKEDYSTKRKAYGDLIIWKEIIRKANSLPVDILYITDDEKVDWWNFEIVTDRNTNKEHKKLLGPHFELIEEFKAYSNKEFHMLTFVEFIDHLTKLRVIDSTKLHYELNKVNILTHYINQQLIDIDLNIDYLIKDLDSFFDYEAEKYDFHIENFRFDDGKEEVFLEINENIASLSGRFILDLMIDGTIKHREETIIKSVLFNLECECNLTLEIEKKEYIVNEGDIKIIKAFNNDVIATISDEIDLYEIYDLKLKMERALRTYNESLITDYEYKLYERFGHVQFISLDEYTEYDEHLGS